jgi:nicotinate-nucleotide pyrophosphorylase (carboxylating)
MSAILPPPLILDPLLRQWLLEDTGRGDRTTASIFPNSVAKGKAHWLLKEDGVIAGLPIAIRIFQILDEKAEVQLLGKEGQHYSSGTIIAEIVGKMDALLTGERVALNIVMHLSGIATMTRKYVDVLRPYHAQLVDTRKTTPGLRILEKYATQVGGAINHRFGLDDTVMIKDNHIKATGSIEKAIALVRENIPYSLTIEVETTNLSEVKSAIDNEAQIIMLDNMSIEEMTEAVKLIHQHNSMIKIEASGNITLDNLQQVAATGVDYISTSATITRSPWLDLSMKFA